MEAFAFGDLLFHSKKSKQNSCQKNDRPPCWHPQPSIFDAPSPLE